MLLPFTFPGVLHPERPPQLLAALLPPPLEKCLYKELFLLIFAWICFICCFQVAEELVQPLVLAD